MSTDHFGKQVSPVFISRVFVEPVSLFAMECRIQFDSFAAVFARDFCDLLQQAAADSFPPETSVYDQLVDMSQVPRLPEVVFDGQGAESRAILQHMSL